MQSKYFQQNDLPVVSFVSMHSKTDKNMHRSLHAHDSICEITLITDGTGLYIYNNEKFKIKPGDIVLANSGDLHEIVSANDEEIGHYAIGLRELRLIGKKENHIVGSEDSCVIHLKEDYCFIKNLIEQLYVLAADNKTSNEYPKQLIFAAVLYLICLKSELKEGICLKKDSDFFAQRVNNYIDEHLTEDFLLDDIACSLSCSGSYLRHTYKNQTGISIRKYITKRRIGLAQTLLISTDLPIKDIAVFSGYNNIDYFSASFAKEVGRSPKAYREQYFYGFKGNKNQL